MDMDKETHEKVMQIAGDVKAALAAIEESRRISEENRRALRGTNGDEGLVAKMNGQQKSYERMEKSLEVLSKKVSDIDDTLCGTDDKTGLITRVKNIEKFKDDSGKWGAIILTFVILDILSKILPGVYSALANGLH